MIAPVTMDSGVRASSQPENMQAITKLLGVLRYAIRMKASMSALKGSETLVGRMSRFTTVTMTKKRRGNKHKITAPAGPLFKVRKAMNEDRFGST